jgi:hypothetical protein
MSIAQDTAMTSDWRYPHIGRATIDILPHDVLLIIFAFYVGVTRVKNGWPTLAHVCQKWRDTVFGSPGHLNLQLVHTGKTAVRGALDVWPNFLPIAIEGGFYSKLDKDNIMATLEHNDRLCEIRLMSFTSRECEKVFAAMQVPFPTLTDLYLRFTTPELVIPDSFLGGSAPCLQRLTLSFHSPGYNTLYLGLPKLLLSAPDLVELSLWNFPHSEYISPEAMVNSLSVLTRLKKSSLLFKEPRSRPDRESRRPPPPTRTLLPSLAYIWFKGVSEYFGDFVALIDTPLLSGLYLIFFHQDIFDTPQLAQFISRTPQLKTLDKARVHFLEVVQSYIIILGTCDQSFIHVEIQCGRLDLQLASLTKVCSLCFPQALINMVKCLYMECDWPDDIDFNKWLELIHPFSAVKNLYLSQNFVLSFVAILQDLVGERVTQVLRADFAYCVSSYS